MSVVEKPVDAINVENSIKEICASHSDMKKVVRAKLPSEMELDTVEIKKSEQPTNGSESKLKDTIDESSSIKCESESTPKPNEKVSESPVEKMEDDNILTNKNGNVINDDDQLSKKNGKIDGDNLEFKDNIETTSGRGEEVNVRISKVGEQVNIAEQEKDTLMKDSCENSHEANDNFEKKSENVEEKIEKKQLTSEQENKAKSMDDKHTNNIEENENKNNDENICSKPVENETEDEEMKEEIKASCKTTEGKTIKDTLPSLNQYENKDEKIESKNNGKQSNNVAENSLVNDEELKVSCEQKTDSKNIQGAGASKTTDEGNTKKHTEIEDHCQEGKTDMVRPYHKENTQTNTNPSVEDEAVIQTNGEKEDKTEIDLKMADQVELIEPKPLSSPENKSTINKETCDDDRNDKDNKEELEDHEMAETNGDKIKSNEQPKTSSDATDLPMEDQEMGEMAENTDNQREETIAEEEPVNQTVYVDENRYFESGTMLELSRIAWISTNGKQQYVRGCLWSPDGTCILTAVNMDGMHVINLPTDLYSSELASDARPLDKLESVINVKEGGTVYDYCWYPFMNSTLPESCCWLSSRQHCPIQLWDGFTGELRGSYRGYDNVDEVEAAFSVTFTSDAEKIIGGYKKSIKIFDTKSPGRDYSVIPIKQPCSCFAVQETQSNIIATGSWNSSINLYDLRTPKLGSLVTLEEHSGGVTFLKFNASADFLYSGARKDNSLLEWDMRNFSRPLRKLYRTVKTNQRIYFDLSPGEKWIASGDTDGLVRVWDLKSTDSEDAFSFELHRDCCNGISFHPSRPMMATSSGQYHFTEDVDDSEVQQTREEVYENSLIFWWIGEMEKGREKETVESSILNMTEDKNIDAEAMET